MGRRITAFAIDGLLLGAIAAVLLARAKHSSISGAPDDACATFNTSICFQSGDHLYQWNSGSFWGAAWLGGLAGFLDLVVLQAATGASIGKLILGLRVIDERGRKANFARMFGRWVMLLIDLACLVVGLLTALISRPHRRVGDFVCGTYVVGVKDLGHPMFDAAAYVSPSLSTSHPQGWSPAGYEPPPSWAPNGTPRSAESQWGRPKPPDPSAPDPTQ
jgi:uncharacterized RDD family membrane protein YckC